MTNIRSTQFIILFYLLCIVLIICTSGCSESTISRPNLDSISDNPEYKFQKQADPPPTAKTLYAMADILATQGRDSECEYILKRIIQENPKLTAAYNKLAELQMRQGLTNTAINTLQDGLRINPEDPILLNNLGMCWIVRRDYENALKMFNKAAGIMPEKAKYRANMAVALGLMGRDEESLSLFKQVLSEEQANHNLNILREARGASKPSHSVKSESTDSWIISQ